VVETAATPIITRAPNRAHQRPVSAEQSQAEHAGVRADLVRDGRHPRRPGADDEAVEREEDEDSKPPRAHPFLLPVPLGSIVLKRFSDRHDFMFGNGSRLDG
jgi:hypothetical protein